MLDEQGAFLLRKSIDDIADRMGVSRITVYNYLSQSRVT
jgi:predicted transcriptional regulator YheO